MDRAAPARYARPLVPPPPDPEAPRGPSEPERAALGERGFALVRRWLEPSAVEWLGRGLRAGQRNVVLELPGVRAALEDWFGGALQVAECELGAVLARDPHSGGWRQEYSCVLEEAELRPLRHAALIGFGSSAAERLEVELSPGSHHTGRLVHRQRAGVSAALPERAHARLLEKPAISFELGPGDALLFHANLLHRLLPAPGPRPREFFVARFDVGDRGAGHRS